MWRRQGWQRKRRDGRGGGRIAAPDPEVRAEGKRRRFTTEYKLRIVKKAEGCGAGEVELLLPVRDPGHLQ